MINNNTLLVEQFKVSTVQYFKVLYVYFNRGIHVDSFYAFLLIHRVVLYVDLIYLHRTRTKVKDVYYL